MLLLPLERVLGADGLDVTLVAALGADGVLVRAIGASVLAEAVLAAGKRMEGATPP